MAKKYSIRYKKPDEVYVCVAEIKAKTEEEAKDTFQKQHPNSTIISMKEA